MAFFALMSEKYTCTYVCLQYVPTTTVNICMNVNQSHSQQQRTGTVQPAGDKREHSKNDIYKATKHT